jgi:hypothetical protein
LTASITLARQIAIDPSSSARCQQHAALPAIGRLVDQPGRLIVVEDLQRAGPVALAQQKPSTHATPMTTTATVSALLGGHHGRD